jgi:hypothetical protein
MAQIDYISPVKTISKTTTYNQQNLYKYLMKWFTERHYDIIEGDYAEKLVDGAKTYHFKWANEKRISEFTKINIKVDFNAKAEDVIQETTKGKRKVQKGDITIKFKGFINKNVEDDNTLSNRPPESFLLGAIYEKFIAKRRMARFEEQLKEDLDAIIKDVKTYLKSHRYD